MAYTCCALLLMNIYAFAADNCTFAVADAVAFSTMKIYCFYACLLYGLYILFCFELIHFYFFLSLIRCSNQNEFSAYSALTTI